MTKDSTVETESTPNTKPTRVAHRWGAVAMLDALGFKGIWKRKDICPVRLAGKMQNMRDELMRFKDSRNELLRDLSGEMKVVAQVLSDTFVFAATVDLELASQLPPMLTQQWLLHQVCVSAASLIRMGLRHKPYLAFRGCVGVGGVWVADDILLGEAVETAAAGHERADAAAVWLTPEAIRISKDSHPTLSPNYPQLWFEWKVPLKNGKKSKPIKSRVVDASLEQAVTRKSVNDTYAKRLLETFDTSSEPDVRRKRRNTEAMLASKGRKGRRHCLWACASE